MKPSKIAQQLRKSISNVHRLLYGLCDAGLVARTGHVTYAYTETHPLRKNGKDEKEERIQ
jgi:DNA-binding IclR family transcriptional regulator